MKFSETWIREWVNPSINNIKLTNQLTMAGFKVDTSTPVSKVFHGTIIGKIIECKNHPKIHTIQTITVDIGEKKFSNIICNNFNCKKNIKVVVANIGALLPNGNKITATTTIQGQLSEGILCTFAMLGISGYVENNIIELPQDAPIGENFYNYFNLHDNIIDINITPNRGDCLNVFGIAREIAIINRLKLKKIKINSITPMIQDIIPVTIMNPEACPQFLGRILKNININVPTPLWIKEKLRRCGVFLENIVTDIIHYVSLEFGHPIHVFDHKTINGKITVRFAEIGEILFLNNNNHLKLFPDTLIVSDEKKILSIAGIIIGSQSLISSRTDNIFLQSAFFYPKIISGKSKLYNISSSSSLHYERGVNPKFSKLALDRVTSLLLQHCVGCYSGPIISIINNDFFPKPKKILLRRNKLNKILGFHIPNTKITYILKKLGFSVIILDSNSWKIFTPTWRFDISIEEHVISEIIRIYGYHKIPKKSINTNLKHLKNYTSKISLSNIKTLLVNQGYQEIITYSFVNPNIQKLLYPKNSPLMIKNPITSTMSSMRLSLWIGLLETMIYNQNRQQKYIKLFESGMCFIPNKKFDNYQLYQNLMIAGIRSGYRFHEHWDIKNYPLVDFYDIKGDVETILNFTHNLQNIQFKPSTHSALHPGQSVKICLKNSNICIGYFGVIHPVIQNQLKLRSRTLVFELLWDKIAKYKKPKIINIYKFPKNYRNISIIVPKSILAGAIINVCKKITTNNILTEIKISDVYLGDGIPKDHKSFTIQLLFQGKTRTLKEKEISDIINQYILILKKTFNAFIK